MMGTQHIWVCALIIVGLIAIAFLGDIFAVAGAYAEVSAFNAMAARRVKGASTAIKLVKHSDRVSSILSDILGDVCGIISGAMGLTMSLVIIQNADNTLFMNALIIALINATIAAVTILAKSIAKKIAIKNCNGIVFFLARVLRTFGIK